MSNLNSVSMKQLRYFVAASDARQFSLAATKVNVSQSAVTAAVHQLEEHMGVQLFERKPSGVALTAEGHQFYRHARHILDTLQDALNEPKFQRHSTIGKVRIGASYTVLGYFLPNLLARFKRSYPDVDIELYDMDREQIEERVLTGDIDLGLIILSNSQRRERFAHHVLIRSRRQLWLANDHTLMSLPKVTLEDVAKQAYIMPTVDEGDTSASRYWQSHGFQPNVAFKTSSMEALRGLVAHGFGITILSDMLYRPWSLEGRKIACRPLDDLVPPMEVGLIWQHQAAFDGATQAMQSFLIQASST